jgi:hypothetical protein
MSTAAVRRSTIDDRTTGHPGYAISPGLYSI